MSAIVRTSRALTSILGAVAAATVLAGCGASSSVSQQSSSPGSEASPAASGAASASAAPTERDDTAHTLVKSGFGLSDGYAWAAALVRNDSPNSGATVVVNFNLLDAAGEILVSESQTESFSRPGQLLVLGTQLTLPTGSKPAKLDATVQVEYPGIGPSEPFPDLPFGPVTVAKDEYGGFEASATLTNPTAQALNSPRIGVICLNAAGQIIGGSSIFPDLVPPNGKVKVKTNSLIVSAEPAKCEMYAGAPA